MQLGNVINIGLGLAFTFFLLSAIASSIQEFIAAVFKWRGTYLDKALNVIISNDSDATFKWYGLGDVLKGHLTWLRGMTVAENQAKKSGQPAAPSPLPFPEPTTDEQRLANAPVAAENLLLRVQTDLLKHPLLNKVPADLPSYISGKNFAVALLSVLRDGSQSSVLQQAAATINALPDEGDLKKTLSAFLFDAGGDVDKFRANIESWFDGAMDRLSGIYKRAAQFALLIIGFPLAVILNVNAVHLAHVLWSMDPASLSALADFAAQAKAVDPSDGTAAASIIKASVTQLQNLSLPIGWGQGLDVQGALSAETWWPHLWHFLVHHLAGWLVTTAAISLGAPFWFDLIQKLIPLRSSGPKPGSAGSAGSVTQN